MSEVTPEIARRFHAVIRIAMMGQWDPIGVSSIPEAADEYDSYVPAVCRLLIEKRPATEIFEYLWQLETEHMGLTGNREATKAFAIRLIELHAQLEYEERRNDSHRSG